MAILNEEELLEDTAEMITHYSDVEVEVAMEWLKNNEWFMENVMSEMWAAQSNYIAEHAPNFEEK